MIQKQEFAIEFKKKIVSNESEILRYDKEFKNNFFIPPREHETIDLDLQLSMSYINSIKKINYQLAPIYISVCDTDPEKDSKVSPFRVHGRILDGKHRYLQAKQAKMILRKVYVKIDNLSDFMFIWTQFINRKTTNKEELKDKIDQLCAYKFEREGIVPPSKICAIVVKELTDAGVSSPTVIRELVPERYKEQYRSCNAKLKALKNTKKKSKKDIIIEELNNEIDALRREIFTLQDKLKEYSEKDIIIDNLQREIEILKKRISEQREEI